MAVTPRLPFAPAVLEWARRSISLSLQDAAARSGFSESQIHKWESGISGPTVVQARKLAETYRRPFAALFADHPPEEVEDIPPDLRQLPGTVSYSADLRLALRNARELRDNLLELEELEPPKLPQWKGSVEAVAAAVRNWVGVTVGEQFEWQDDYRAL